MNKPVNQLQPGDKVTGIDDKSFTHTCTITSNNGIFVKFHNGERGGFWPTNKADTRIATVA